MDLKNLKINGKKLEISLQNSDKELLPEVLGFLQFLKSDDDYYEVKTSGSTGDPKPILLSRKYMEASARKTLTFLNLKRGDRALLCLPVSKVGGMMMLMRWALGELDLYTVEPMAQPLKKLRGNFDFVAMVPYQVAQSLEDVPRIKKLIIGGGPISPSLEKDLKNLPNEIYHTYGMTETISHVAMRRINGNTDFSLYKAMPGISFNVDERDCLIIHAPHIGVKNLLTNDVVKLISAESFEWIGRVDNVVNSGGIKLYPEEIEQKIGELGMDYFLASLPDEQLGQKLIMVVDKDSSLSEAAIRKRLQFLKKYEIPKSVFFLPILKTVNGKLKRHSTLRQLHHQSKT